jgi:hypothetical protein
MKEKLLGHIVSDSRISIDPERITAILNLLASTSKKKFQSFMGIINFFHRSILDFTVMVKPIHNILKHDRSFFWTNDVENSFLTIKKQSTLHRFWQNQILRNTLSYIPMPSRNLFYTLTK